MLRFPAGLRSLSTGLLVCATLLGACSSSDSSPAQPTPANGGSAGEGGSGPDSSTGGMAGQGGSGLGGTAGQGGAQGGTAGAAGIAGAGGANPEGGTELCNSLKEGLNEGFMVDGISRSFILNLPTGVETKGPWPVIFNWHGLGDTASNMSQLISGYVNDTSFPFIGVTPEDSDFALMGQSLDWEVFTVDAAKNREARLFDEILTCLQTRYSIDSNHVHSMGFSMGSIVTDLLGTIRGDKLASTLTYSGAYFSNQENVATLGMLASMVSWPTPNHTNAYAQIILHGGTADTYALGGALTVHFDTFAANDTKYLNGLSHAVILCNHGEGHAAPVQGFDTPQVLEFFKAHPKGTVSSPFGSGLPTDYPAYCEVKAP